MAEFRTIEGAVGVEMDKIKGSRFIADAAPAADADAAYAFIESVREREHGATHHCWAYRLDIDTARSSDDGEPAGSAGAPILRRIDGANLSEVVVVVTRYYGGTKLGTGGLIRAYGGAAVLALDAGTVVVRRTMTRFAIEHDYEISGAVQGVLAAYGVAPSASSFEMRVSLEVAVPDEVADAFARELLEATAGRVEARRLG